MTREVCIDPLLGSLAVMRVCTCNVQTLFDDVCGKHLL